MARTIIELIAATTTTTGLSVTASYDPNWSATGLRITDRQRGPASWTRGYVALRDERWLAASDSAGGEGSPLDAAAEE